MPEPTRFNWGSWPGLAGIKGITYTVSHGITPGVVLVTAQPQPLPPDLIGTLVLYDGVETIALPNCKVQAIHCEMGRDGMVWKLEIVDRRWKWRECGCIAGTYNLPDHTGEFNRPPPDSGPILASPVKYIPWSVRTPQQLASYCLNAMGEVGYTILLPDTGPQNLPEVHWDHVNPAQALQSLCESLGCRVIYRTDTDSVLIAPLGLGAELPLGSIAREAPSIGLPPTPDQIVLIGAPVRHQCRLVLEAVGEEWDGSLRPINDLSYAPDVKATREQIRLAVTDPTTDVVLRFFVDDEEIHYTCTGASVGTAITGLAAVINASGHASTGKIKATVDGGGLTLTVTGPPDGSSYVYETAETQVGGSITVLAWTLLRAGQKADGPWELSGPPSFGNVKATDRLTRQQAIEHARKSVFRYYRVVNLDAFDRKSKLTVPSYGPIARVEQLLLQSTLLDYTVPQQPDWTTLQKDGQPVIEAFYDGYSRERPAVCYGSYYPPAAGIRLLDKTRLDKRNSLPQDPVLVPFQIDATRQLVIFSSPVYVLTGRGVKAADLTLETSFQIRDTLNNQVVRTRAILNTSGPPLGTPPAYIRHDDVQLMVANRYNVKTLGVVSMDHNAVEMRQKALYYLVAEANKYELRGTGSRTYNGLVHIPLDGAIHQVTYTVGPSGATTVASRNSEHSSYVPSFPQRLRLEYLRSPEKLLVNPKTPPKDRGKPVE